MHVRSLVHLPSVGNRKGVKRVSNDRPSTASPSTALFARRSTASVRPADSESRGSLDRQQDVAPRRSRRGAPSSERSAGSSRGRGTQSKGDVMTYFVGLDWAAREHAICAVDERGTVVTRFTATHAATGLDELV